MWIASCVLYSVYTFSWDVKVDWGLAECDAGKNKFLRQHLIFPSKVSKTN